MKRALIFFFTHCYLFMMFSCKHLVRNEGKILYSHKESFLREFANTSVIRSRGKNLIELSYRNKNKINKFYFEKQDDDTFKLTKEIIQIDLRSIEQTRLITQEDSKLYNTQMCNILNRYLQKMDSLNIRDISTQFYLQGIDSKIYFNSSNSLLYVSDPKNVKNKEWINFLRKCKKFDRNWYYEEN